MSSFLFCRSLRRRVATLALICAGIAAWAGDVESADETKPNAAATAADPSLEKTDLFEAGEEGYELYRIPGIVVTGNGTVLAYCEARKSSSGDWGPIDVLMRRSTDGGKTWGPRQKIVHVEGDLPMNPVAAAQDLDKPGENTVNNPVAIVDHDSGAVHFLYCLEYMRCFYMRSDDDGVSWTEPVEITSTFEKFRVDYDWKVIATGPSHAIQLTHGDHRGRLVVPVWLSLGTGGHAHRPSVTATIYSDDHGKTWQRGEIAVPDTPDFVYPNESVVVQLADGRVMLNSRSESKRHRRLITTSDDGATGWSAPRFDPALLEPICMAGLVRVRDPQDGKPGLLAFSNPHNLSRGDGKATPGKGRDRDHVSIKLSEDEGTTWPAHRTLEKGFSGYSDLAALDDGTMLCFYERGSTDGESSYRSGRLTVARFNEAWVREGDVSAEKVKALRILPLGDSITRGTYLARDANGKSTGLPHPDSGGYRKPLQDLLRKGGIAFDFVGDLDYSAYGRDGKVDPEFDPDHHGLAGFSNTGLLRGGKVPTMPDVLDAMGVDELSVPGIAEVLKKHRPDVILLMSGANGFGAEARDDLIRAIGEHNEAHLIVGTILPQSPARKGWKQVAEYNASLPAIVEAQQEAGKSITLVDMHAALSVDDLLPDGVHPSQAGMDKMAAVWFAAIAGRAEAKLSFDVCVYGGTSGGVAAAVQAARMGKRVALVEPGRHLGGMTSGGLSAVDIGEPRSVGGIAREYFTRLVANYGKELNWGEAFKGQGGPATGGAYSIEPHVAEKVFDEMAAEAGVVVLKEARMESVEFVLIGNASGHGATLRINSLELEDGREVKASMFIDATYEGDLLAKSGTDDGYTLIREGNAKYGESYNGIRYTEKYQPRTGHLQPGENGRVKGGQGAWDRDYPLDPYVVKGDPASGLLPLINEGEPGTQGEPAPGVQAYCFRLCLTTDPANSIPIAPPADYDPKRYEVVARFIEACIANGDDMDLRWFSKHDPLPNDKWDFNTATFGGNLPGLSWAWPEASYTEREDLAKQLENYHRGLFHFLRTDPRVPEKVRRDVERFALPKDEFTDNGGWPHQVYVREGRRMVSDFVMTEHHTFGREAVPKPIGLGSYGTDAHEIRRIVKDGVVTREGKIATGRGGFGPYGISYDALIPKRGKVDNLLVTFALSASHSAFASIRMEPPFMITSQSAATAACQAIDAGVTVQEVDYELLRERLLADGQVLEWAAVNAKAALKLSGIVIDDNEAQLMGDWVKSNASGALLGGSYRHDGNVRDGRKTAAFVPEIPEAGDYEVRLLYTAHENRASNANVYVEMADGRETIKVNQRQSCLVEGVPSSLGVFRFEKGRAGKVIVTNHGSDGYVVVDGIQLVPVAIAREERAGKRDSGFGKMEESNAAPKNPAAAAVAFSPLAEKAAPTKEGPSTSRRSNEAVQLAKPAAASQVDGRHYDVVIVGATGGGVACAVRAAREGCSVLLVQHNGHIGGMMTNGLMQWDALYGGPRSALFSELLGNIENYYIETFGRDSAEHQIIRCTHEHYPISWAEPHVAEREYNRLVAGEPNITLLLDHYPASVDRDGELIKRVTLNAREEPGATIGVTGAIFVDASYEGDLLALAKVPYRAGREARDEYKEPHAGKVFGNIDHSPPLGVTKEELNIRVYGGRQGSIDPSSPFSADRAVQAYNYRFCVSSDPTNRMPIPKPAGYRREEYIDYGRKYIASPNGPNRKSHVNSPILPGENHDYPEADWPARDKITQRHLDFGLGLMWFLQNDESVSEKDRKRHRAWGLPKDEYADNGHVPYEMYVRETRRLVGRHVLTELDGMLAGDYARTPIHADSIATTDWYMDSHSCTTDSRPGFKYDGKLILTEESRPTQVPYRSLLPQGVDNLLVPVCLSATHISWGSIRLEPVFLQTGEAAGFAAALAKQQNTTPAALDSDRLVRALVNRGQLVSFFNDVKVGEEDPAIRAAQYFGMKGFFSDYDAHLDEPLTEAVAKLWAEAFAQLEAGDLDPRELAARIHEAQSEPSLSTGRTRGEGLVEMWKQLD